jgi:hypothetical protein
MKQLSDHDGNVILIDVFTVEPLNHQRLVQLLTRVTNNAVGRALGLTIIRGPLLTQAVRAQGKCRSRSEKKIRNSPTRRYRPHS